MTNAESCHPEVRRGISLATSTKVERRFLGGPRNDPCSSFGFSPSFVIGYFVIRHLL